MTIRKGISGSSCESPVAPREFELIARVAAGETEAFYELIRPHERNVGRRAREEHPMC